MTSAIESSVDFLVHGGPNTRFLVSPVGDLTSVDRFDLATRLVIVFL